MEEEFVAMVASWAYPPSTYGMMAPDSQRRTMRLSYEMTIRLDVSTPCSHHCKEKQDMGYDII